MNISKRGLQFITDCEGYEENTFRDGVFYAHWDKIGQVWDIAWGLTIDLNGDPIGKNTTMTYDEALACFSEYTDETAARLTQLLNLNAVTLQQHQFDALCAFAYNIGFNAFKRDATAYKKVMAKQFDEVTRYMLNWVHANKKFVFGLYNRRIKEAIMFDKGIYTQNTDFIEDYEKGEYIIKITRFIRDELKEAKAKRDKHGM